MHFTSTLVSLSGLALAAAAPPCVPGGDHKITNIQLGPRPFWLIDNMEDGPLKEKLASCSEKPRF